MQQKRKGIQNDYIRCDDDEDRNFYLFFFFGGGKDLVVDTSTATPEKREVVNWRRFIWHITHHVYKTP